MTHIPSSPTPTSSLHSFPPPSTDPSQVLSSQTKEWHFHIYFLLQSPTQKQYALQLRDAVLRLRRAGVFVAVPLARVNEYPMGPHPAGSYEIWVPHTSFSSVHFYLSANRGPLSILVHPLTPHQRLDHSSRSSWIGPSWPLYLDSLPEDTPGGPPAQYKVLKMGWNEVGKDVGLEERWRRGGEVEELLKGDEEAAPCPE